MADDGSKLALIGLAFLIGLVIGYLLSQRRRSFLTEFTRDASGRIIQVFEMEVAHAASR